MSDPHKVPRMRPRHVGHWLEWIRTIAPVATVILLVYATFIR